MTATAASARKEVDARDDIKYNDLSRGTKVIGPQLGIEQWPRIINYIYLSINICILDKRIRSRRNASHRQPKIKIRLGDGTGLDRQRRGEEVPDVATIRVDDK